MNPSNKIAINLVRLGRSACKSLQTSIQATTHRVGSSTAGIPVAAVRCLSTATSNVVSTIDSLPAHVVMPSARVLMAQHAINPQVFQGKTTGKGGRITKGDVLRYLGDAPPLASTSAAGAPASSPVAASLPPAGSASLPSAGLSSSPLPSATPVPTPRAGYVDTKPSQVRRIIAQRLTESKAGIPHQYGVLDCRIDGLMKLRSALKESGVAVSVNDMIVKAVAKALKDVPEANCIYDAKTDTVRPNPTIDISVAVATEGGLITPIVKGADKLGLLDISEKVKDLAGRARANKLKPEEFQGGSFTISNLGMFGIDEFSAVINPPQACILAVGKGEKKVVAAPLKSLDDTAEPPAPTVATVMTVMMSSDARVLDAAVAGQFLQVFQHYIQNPSLLVA